MTYNPKYEELFAPEVGPENPFKTQQQKAKKNMLSGYVEKAHLNEFQFENQRRTFHSFGFAIDPSVTPLGKFDNGVILSDSVALNHESIEKTVFESNKGRPLDKRKRKKNNDPSDIEGFLGPWAAFEDEQRIIKPNEVCFILHCYVIS